MREHIAATHLRWRLIRSRPLLILLLMWLLILLLIVCPIKRQGRLEVLTRGLPEGPEA